MSIENLNGSNFPFILNNILTQNIDTPISGQTLSLGTVNAATVVVGPPAGVVKIQGTEQVNIIDTAAVGATLFIGPNDAGNIQLSRAAASPVTIPPGIITTNINVAGILPPGPLTIGNNLSTTEIDIGQAASAVKIFGGSLQFPTTLLTPLVITDSQVSQVTTIPFTGAIVNPVAAILSFYKFGDWVTVEFRHLLVPQVPTVSGVALTCLNVLPINYRPLVSNRNFTILIADNGVTQAGQAFIQLNGDISMGNALNGTLNGPGTVAVFDWSYTFNVNG